MEKKRMDLYIAIFVCFTAISFIFFILSTCAGFVLLSDIETLRTDESYFVCLLLFLFPAVMHFAFMIPALILSIIAFKNKSKLGLAFLIVNISKAAITLIILAILLIVTA